jgi:hypothetical protein
MMTPPPHPRRIVAMNADDMNSPAEFGPLVPPPASDSRVSFDPAARQKGPTFSESLALGLARIFGLEPFLADSPDQSETPGSDRSIRLDLKRQRGGHARKMQTAHDEKTTPDLN